MLLMAMAEKWFTKRQLCMVLLIAMAENCLAKRAKETSVRRSKLNVFENIYNAMRACEPPEPSALAARFCTPLNASWSRITLIISCTHPTSGALWLDVVDRGGGARVGAFAAAAVAFADRGAAARVGAFAATAVSCLRLPMMPVTAAAHKAGRQPLTLLPTSNRASLNKKNMNTNYSDDNNNDDDNDDEYDDFDGKLLIHVGKPLWLYLEQLLGNVWGNFWSPPGVGVRPFAAGCAGGQR